MAGSWFYMQDNKRMGPVALEELKHLAASGALRREDTVWTVGMNQWTPAGQVPVVFGSGIAAPPVDLQPSIPATEAPFAAPQADVPAYATPTLAAPATVSYYDGGLPPRAATTLRGHAAPTGDTGDWPLDDMRVAQFTDALKVRKKVTGAAGLYRALLLLSAIGLVIILFAGVGMALTGGGRGAPAGVIMLGIGGMVGGLCVLYFFTSRATMRAHRWAPLTMLVLFGIAVAMNLFSIAMGASNGRPEELIGGVFGMVLPAIFAVVSWNSFAAIPRWRSQPAWCQELIVKAGQ